MEWCARQVPRIDPTAYNPGIVVASNHILFLISSKDNDFSKISSVKNKTAAQWITNSLIVTGISPDKFTAHSINPARCFHSKSQDSCQLEFKRGHV